MNHSQIVIYSYQKVNFPFWKLFLIIQQFCIQFIYIFKTSFEFMSNLAEEFTKALINGDIESVKRFLTTNKMDINGKYMVYNFNDL